jgi:hypothetical protein
MPDWIKDAFMSLSPRGRAFAFCIVGGLAVAAGAALVWRYGWPA